MSQIAVMDGRFKVPNVGNATVVYSGTDILFLSCSGGNFPALVGALCETDTAVNIAAFIAANNLTLDNQPKFEQLVFDDAGNQTGTQEVPNYADVLAALQES